MTTEEKVLGTRTNQQIHACSGLSFVFKVMQRNKPFDSTNLSWLSESQGKVLVCYALNVMPFQSRA